MIKDANFAQQVSELMLDLSARIRQSVTSAANYPTDDRQRYQKAAAQVLLAIDSELLAPLYAEHPSLRPAGWTRSEPQPAQSRSLGGIIQPV
jgi:hypothetical protein